MSSVQTPMSIAQEFLDGRTKARIKRNSLYIDVNGASGPGLYSYGNHFPVLLEDVNGLLLNTEKSTVTTNKVVAATRLAVLQNGYLNTGNDVTLVDENGVSRTFQLFKPQQG